MLRFAIAVIMDFSRQINARASWSDVKQRYDDKYAKDIMKGDVKKGDGFVHPASGGPRPPPERLGPPLVTMSVVLPS